MVNNEEHVHRVLADTGASSIILEVYTLAPFIKTDDRNTTMGVTLPQLSTVLKNVFLLGVSCG
jgi:hypothetical protein